MQQWREKLLDDLRRAERTLDLLSELELRLKKETGREDLKPLVTRLEHLIESYPEGHSVRLLIEAALRHELVGRVGRARSAVEGQISTLRSTPHHNVS